MSPTEWGPPTWTLFHTLTEKIKEESYPQIGFQLFSYICRICYILPCPDCSQHARDFLAKIKPEHVKTKDGLRNLMYMFHNVVNKRKNKPMYNSQDLAKYKELNIITVYNKFISIYKTTGNMKLLAESFQRKMLVSDFKKWMTSNYHHFT